VGIDPEGVRGENQLIVQYSITNDRIPKRETIPTGFCLVIEY